MTVAVRGARAAPVPTLLDRALAAYPVALLYLGLSILYGWQASKHVSPFVFSDELQWAELSRGIAHTGHPELRLRPASAGSIYAYLIAPAWWLGPTARAYEAVKYIGTLGMTASLIPAYLLARTVASRPLALFAAAGTATVPALIYGAMILPEPIAYTYSTLCLYAIAVALIRRTAPSAALAAALVLVAPAVRGELAVLVPTAVVAVAVYAATSDPGRRLIASWSISERLAAGLLGLGAAIVVNAILTHRSYTWQVGTHFSDRMLEYGVWATGAFVIGVGVLPAVATLAWILSAHQRRPEERAFLGVAVGAIVAFGLYTAVKSSYISTNFATRVEERNLIYLSPVLFVGTAVWLARLRTHLLAVGVATAAIVYVLVSTPYHLENRLYSDAPGLAILAAANRHWAWNQAYAQNVLVSIAAVSAVLLALSSRLRAVLSARPAPAAGLAALIAGAILAWTLTAEWTAASASRASSQSVIGAFPKPPDWIDARTDRQRTLFVGQGINENTLYPLEFWNQSIGEVWSLDARTPPPGPSVTPNLQRPDGTLDPQRDVRWTVGDNGVEFAGTPVERHGAIVLYRVTPPIRITSSTNGVYDDGWTGHDAAFGRYSGRPGIARLVVSRAGATGREPRTRVTVRLGTVRIDENGQPQIAKQLLKREFTIGGREVQTLTLPATPPYRIEVHVSRTFRPADFGIPDARELGVQVGHRFVPAHGRS